MLGSKGVTMRFSLYYRGTLRANGNREHKHDLRLHFHSQLDTLWNQPPLSTLRDAAFDPNPADPGQGSSNPNLAAIARLSQPPSLVVDIAGHSFVPLVAQGLRGVASLRVRLLRPEPPGRLITQGGDIDNRLKTLFDAMKIPDQNQLTERSIPNSQPNAVCA